MDTASTLSDSLVQTLCDRQVVQSNSDVMSGALVFVGTRVPLQTLFDYIEGEDGLNEFLEDFPHLKVPALQVLELIAPVIV
jgi:uncharacterized protein (DUF433 family)